MPPSTTRGLPFAATPARALDCGRLPARITQVKRHPRSPSEDAELAHEAWRGPHVALQRDSHCCYEIEVPTENASELFKQALRQLEEESD